MNEALRKLLPTMSEDTDSATSLPVSGVGAWPFDTQASPIANLSGVVHAPASPFPVLHVNGGNSRGFPTSGTYGPHGTTSSASANLQLFLESKLRTQFALGGSTMYSVILKKVSTPAGRQLCQLTRLAQTMNEKDYIGLPTPCARDTQDLSRFGPFKASMARRTHSLTTRLLALGVPWEGISLIYCLVMGYPSAWNNGRYTSLVTPSYRKRQQRS